MADQISGVLIDPFTKTVSTIAVPSDSSVRLGPYIDCEAVDFVILRHADAFGPGVQLIVDDAGLYREEQAYWCFKNNLERIFAGKGLILAFDPAGEPCEGLAPPEAVAPHIIFRHLKYVGSSTSVTEPAQPGGMVHIKVKAEFEPGEDQS